SASPNVGFATTMSPTASRASRGGRWRLRSALSAGGLHPGVLVEDHLADAHRLRGDLHALVLPGELQRLLQGERARRGEVLERLRCGGPDVVELLLLGDVHVHVLTAGVLADDHALVDLVGGLDEEGAAVLQ